MTMMTARDAGMTAATDGMGTGTAATTGANVAGAPCVTTTMTIVPAVMPTSSCGAGIRSFASSAATGNRRRPVSTRPSGCSTGCNRSLAPPRARLHRHPRHPSEIQGRWSMTTAGLNGLILANAVPSDDHFAETVPLPPGLVVAVAISAPPAAAIPIAIPVAPVSVALPAPIALLPVAAIVPIAIHPGLRGNTCRQAAGENASCKNSR
jgi:hypothetical protein